MTTEHPCVISPQWLFGCRRRVKCRGSWGGRSPVRNAVSLWGTPKQPGEEKRIPVADKAFDFGNQWRALSACTKQGLPKDRNTPVKCTRMYFGMTAPSDHNTGLTAWQAVLAAYGDAWEDILAINYSTESKIHPMLCWGRLTVKSEVLF